MYVTVFVRIYIGNAEASQIFVQGLDRQNENLVATGCAAHSQD